MRIRVECEKTTKGAGSLRGGRRRGRRQWRRGLREFRRILWFGRILWLGCHCLRPPGPGPKLLDVRDTTTVLRGFFSGLGRTLGGPLRGRNHLRPCLFELLVRHLSLLVHPPKVAEREPGSL